MKAGGRGGGAEEIEGLRVILGPKKGSGGVRDGDVDVGGGRGGGGGGKERKVGTTESVRLGDVASVVARGRNVGVLVGEKEVRSCGSVIHSPLAPIPYHSLQTSLSLPPSFLPPISPLKTQQAINQERVLTPHPPPPST